MRRRGASGKARGWFAFPRLSSPFFFGRRDPGIIFTTWRLGWRVERGRTTGRTGVRRCSPLLWRAGFAEAPPSGWGERPRRSRVAIALYRLIPACTTFLKGRGELGQFLAVRVIRTVGEFGLVGLVGFRFGFGDCDFSRENGKKFGLVGFYRFSIGRRKANGGERWKTSNILHPTPNIQLWGDCEGPVTELQIATSPLPSPQRRRGRRGFPLAVDSW